MFESEDDRYKIQNKSYFNQAMKYVLMKEIDANLQIFGIWQLDETWLYKKANILRLISINLKKRIISF